MRLHTDTLTASDLNDAARIARVDLVTSSRHGSRSRDHAFEVKLEGESRRRPNGGSSGAGSGYAATWDQWGVFLGVLFDRDFRMTCWAYDGVDAFDSRTNFRFNPDGRRHRATGPDYWPADAHGDHTFRYAGIPFEQSCTKCSAVQRWQ